MSGWEAHGKQDWAQSAQNGGPVWGKRKGRHPSEGYCHRNWSRRQWLGLRVRSGRSGCNLPILCRLGPEGPKSAAGDEVALKVERVVDRSMHREKALG